jgi:hypothetical protein
MLTQLPLGGSQYMKMWWDDQKRRHSHSISDVRCRASIGGSDQARVHHADTAPAEHADACGDTIRS